MEKLIKNGIWSSRPGEITPIQFVELFEFGKKEYVDSINKIPEEERSTYEKVILSMYKKEYKNK
jgi:hypothetical protein